MNRTAIRFLVIASLALLVALAAACGDDDTSSMGNMSAMGNAPEGSIRVDLLNWAIAPAQASAKSGNVTFWAVHSMGHMHGDSEGGVTHDLQVTKKNADGTYAMAGQVQGLKMGEAKALTLSLAPGDYELSCNVVEMVNGEAIAHYAKGMHTTFTVV